MGRRAFTAEFKREAVKLAQQPDAVMSKIAEDLGLHPNMLRNWVKQFGSGKWESKPGAALKSEQQAEIERLRRELSKVKTERDILKKAMAYFAKEPQ
jgi:transposase